MALEKETLIDDIKKALTFDPNEKDPKKLAEVRDVATALANAIDAFVKSGEVVEIKTRVTTSGTAQAQEGVGIQDGEGKIQ